jgi:hypothetical protein
MAHAQLALQGLSLGHPLPRMVLNTAIACATNTATANGTEYRYRLCNKYRYREWH